jgi:hypothetical protein
MKRQTVVAGVKLAAAILVFAVMMALRTQATASWVRIVLAAGAFVVLAVAVLHVRAQAR